MTTKPDPVPLNEVRAWVDSFGKWLVNYVKQLDRDHPAAVAFASIPPDDPESTACAALATLAEDPRAFAIAGTLSWLACSVLRASDKKIPARARKRFVASGGSAADPEVRERLASVLYDDTVEATIENGIDGMVNLLVRLPFGELRSRRQLRAALTGDSELLASTARLEQHWRELFRITKALRAEFDDPESLFRRAAAIFDDVDWVPLPTPLTLAAWNDCRPQVEERLQNAGMTSSQIAELMPDGGSPDDGAVRVRNRVSRLGKQRERRRQLMGLPNA